MREQLEVSRQEALTLQTALKITEALKAELKQTKDQLCLAKLSLVIANKEKDDLQQSLQTTRQQLSEAEVNIAKIKADRDRELEEKTSRLKSLEEDLAIQALQLEDFNSEAEVIIRDLFTLDNEKKEKALLAQKLEGLKKEAEACSKDLKEERTKCLRIADEKEVMESKMADLAPALELFFQRFPVDECQKKI